MKYRILLALLSIFILLALCSCGGKGNTTTTAEPDRTTVPTTTSSTSQTTPAVTTPSTTLSTSEITTPPVTTTTPPVTTEPVVYTPVTEYKTRLSQTDDNTRMDMMGIGEVFDSVFTDTAIQGMLTSYFYDYDKADDGFESCLDVLKSYDIEFFKTKLLLCVRVSRGGYELPEVTKVNYCITPPISDKDNYHLEYSVEFAEPLQKTNCDRDFWVFIEVDRPDLSEYGLNDQTISVSCNTSDSALVSRPSISYQTRCIETPAQKPISGPYEYRITTYEELQALLEKTEKDGIFGSELTQALTEYDRDFFVTKFLSVVVTEGQDGLERELVLADVSRNGYELAVFLPIQNYGNPDIKCYHLIWELEKDIFGVAPQTQVDYLIPSVASFDELSSYPYTKPALDRWEKYLASQED